VKVETPIETLRHTLRIICSEQGNYPSVCKTAANANIERYWADMFGAECPEPMTALFNIGEPELITLYEGIQDDAKDD
jgi:hypothetical protein